MDIEKLINQKKINTKSDISKDIIELRDELTQIDKTRNDNTKNETKVDQPVTNDERKKIEKALDDLKNIASKRMLVEIDNKNSFRLDNPHDSKALWEIQRNGCNGMTTVSQVKYPKSIYNILYAIENKQLQNSFEELIRVKLKESLNSSKDGKIKKAFITLDDLIDLFKK